MGSFQSLHANREARDPLPIVIAAVAMPLGVYTASSNFFLFFFISALPRNGSQLSRSHNTRIASLHAKSRAHDPSAADNSPPPPQLAEVSSP